MPALLCAADRKYRVVLVTKSRQSMDHMDRTTGSPEPVATTGGKRSTPPCHATRWETTCGAGLPVIVALNWLVAAGDPVTRIAGAFSGTLALS